MKVNFGSVDSGKIIIKVVASNRTSMTLRTEDIYQEKVIHPRHDSFGTMGEHGISMTIKIVEGDSTHLILFDTAGFMQTLINNFTQFKLQLKEIEKIIISHGHLDHFGALIPIMPDLKKGSEIYLNPICLTKGYYARTVSGYDIPSEDLGLSFKRLKRDGKLQFYRRRRPINKKIVYDRANTHDLQIVETRKPEKLYNGVITSGEIEIFDESELPKGLYLGTNKTEYAKHTYREEIVLYINVKDKGLIVITGCSHTGIINIVKHGQKLTGVDRIYALIGGFHKEMESRENIEEIVSFIEKLNPEITCGMHCTGFEFNRIMHRHPSHVMGVVGTEFHL